MRKLNKKQIKWVEQNVKSGMTIFKNDWKEIKCIDFEMGYYIVNEILTYAADPDWYDVGMITKEELESGTGRVVSRDRGISSTSEEWKKWFPNILEIKSK